MLAAFDAIAGTKLPGSVWPLLTFAAADGVAGLGSKE